MAHNRDEPLHVLLIHKGKGSEGYEEYLRSEGFVTSEANDSEEGVTKALELAPDLIVLDFDLDGETTTRLKSHIATSKIPVIALAKLEQVRVSGAVS